MEQHSVRNVDSRDVVREINDKIVHIRQCCAGEHCKEVEPLGTLLHLMIGPHRWREFVYGKKRFALKVQVQETAAGVQNIGNQWYEVEEAP